MAFVAQTAVNFPASVGISFSPTIPSGTASGQVAVMVWTSTNSKGSAYTEPTGWTMIGTRRTNGAQTYAIAEYWKLLGSGDPGSAIAGMSAQSSTGAAQTNTVTIAVYSGISSTSPINVSALALETTSGTAHATPTVTTTAANCTIVEMVGDKGGPPSSSWSASAGTVRGSVCPTGPAQLSQATGDHTQSAAGLSTSTTWTGTLSTQNAFMAVFALASGSQPAASFTYTTTTLTANVTDTSTPVSPATISTRSWDWGDGTTAGTGSTASHTYAGGGTYTLTLTVTDSNGLTASATQSVTVTPATVPSSTTGVTSVDVSTGWAATGGTAVAVLNDTDLATFVQSSANPSALEFDFTLPTIAAPATGQPFRVFLAIDAPQATTATLAAQLVQGATTRSSLTGVAIPAGAGSTVAGAVTLNFPSTDVSAVTSWAGLHVKLQVTAS